jgi:hypothetical protein
MKSLVAISLLWVIPGLFTPCLATGQTAVDSAAAVRKLLDDTWGGDVQDRRAGLAAWRDYQSTHAAEDPVVRWAWVLNRIQYDKYREAREAIKPLLQAGSRNWDQRYTGIWLQLCTGEIDAALLELRHLKQAFVNTAGVDETTRSRFFTRMGRLVGFIEGPAASAATPVTLQQTLAIITDGLNDTDYGSFEDQRQQVVQKYARLLNEKNATVARQEQDRQLQIQSRTSQLLDDNRVLAERQQTLTAEREQLRSQAAAEITALRESGRPLESQLPDLDSRLRQADRDINRIANDIGWLEYQAFCEPDFHLRGLLYERARILREDLFDAQGQAAILQDEYDAVAGQINLINEQIATVQDQLASEVAWRNDEFRELNAQRRRNQRELGRLTRPAARTGYERAMSARTAHLPTYDPFPAHEFRGQLLSRLP